MKDEIKISYIILQNMINPLNFNTFSAGNSNISKINS